MTEIRDTFFKKKREAEQSKGLYQQIKEANSAVVGEDDAPITKDQLMSIVEKIFHGAGNVQARPFNATGYWLKTFHKQNGDEALKKLLDSVTHLWTDPEGVDFIEHFKNPIPMDQKTDATGQPLQVGEVYGYSKRSNGHVKVNIGTLRSIGDKMVKLDLIESRKAIYAGNPEIIEPTRDYVTVIPNTIFKLEGYDRS